MPSMWKAGVALGGGVVLGLAWLELRRRWARAALAQSPSAPSEKSGPRKVLFSSSLETYTGFKEHAYRLVFHYGDKFPQTPPPMLNTILPSGVLENNRELVPVAEKGLMCYGFAQTILPEKAKDLPATKQPFVWERADGTLALVQTWSTSVNEKFKEQFEVSLTNPDTSIFSTQAVEEFKRTLTSLFGEGALKQEPVMFCHRASVNTKPVLVGDRATLLAHLASHPEALAELNIARLTDDGFVAATVSGKGEKGEKPFALGAGVYAIYVKMGWHTMACATPIDQFMDGRELHGGTVKPKSRLHCVIA